MSRKIAVYAIGGVMLTVAATPALAAIFPLFSQAATFSLTDAQQAALTAAVNDPTQMAAAIQSANGDATVVATIITQALVGKSDDEAMMIINAAVQAVPTSMLATVAQATVGSANGLNLAMSAIAANYGGGAVAQVAGAMTANAVATYGPVGAANFAETITSTAIRAAPTAAPSVVSAVVTALPSAAAQIASVAVAAAGNAGGMGSNPSASLAAELVAIASAASGGLVSVQQVASAVTNGNMVGTEQSLIAAAEQVIPAMVLANTPVGPTQATVAAAQNLASSTPTASTTSAAAEGSPTVVAITENAQTGNASPI